MILLLDDARIPEIRQSVDIFPICGVTTNPTIIKAANPDSFYDHLSRVREIIGKERQLHVQVVDTETEGMLAQADKILSHLGGNVCIKVPVTRAGLPAIRRLKDQDVCVTATAVYSTMQGLLAIAAGADYLAPYVNRMSNLDIDALSVIEALRCEIDRNACATRILAASFKNLSQITGAIQAGAHAVTLSPELLDQAVGMAEVTLAVDAFATDWASTFTADPFS